MKPTRDLCLSILSSMALDNSLPVCVIHNYKFLIGKPRLVLERGKIVPVRKLMAVMLGDRYGIGPELVASFLGSFEGDDHLQLMAVGDPAVFEQARSVAGQNGPFPVALDLGAPRAMV
jgi:hypothetical protein